MTFLDELIHDRQSPIAVYHQFLLNNKPSIRCYHMFVEGDADYSFYTGFLLRFMSNTEYLFSYQCGGKANIYDTYQKVINVPSHGVALFFVDKDFSDILHETYPIAENIYVTDFYSIENYLVSEDMLTRIWNELFHFPKAMISIKSTQSKFRLELEHFYNVFLPLMAWIISLRRSGLKPNLNNINLSNIFFINDDLSLEKRGEASNIDEIEILEKMCGVTTTQECRSNIDLSLKNLLI